MTEEKPENQTSQTGSASLEEGVRCENAEIMQIMGKLHKTEGLPRLVIYGLGKIDEEAAIQGFSPYAQAWKDVPKAVYVEKDTDFQSGTGSSQGSTETTDWEHVVFPRQNLEMLIRDALHSPKKESSMMIIGEMSFCSAYWTYENGGYRDEAHCVPELLSVHLKIDGDKPTISITHDNLKKSENSDSFWKEMQKTYDLYKQ